MEKFLGLLVACLSMSVCKGHGNLDSPATWLDPNGANVFIAGNEPVMWFTNYTFNVGGPTIPEDDVMITYPTSVDGTENNPWRAPGTAKIFSPCGIDGGNPTGCPSGQNGSRSACVKSGETLPGCECPGGGYGFGVDAISVTFPETVVTEWRVGSVVEAAWAIQANHGGGYSYRLCPKNSSDGLTEECFQKEVLDFVGDYQSVQYGQNETTRQYFLANRTRTGTHPAGSHWTKNPIPACASPLGGGGAYAPPGKCLFGTEFTPPLPGLYGFGESIWNNYQHEFDFSIVDQLQVPQTLPEGDYVLSFRWDCEQTPQVWNMCSDIRIVA